MRRNLRQVSYYTFLFSMLLMANGCMESPEERVEKYLEYTFMDDDGENAYQMLASDDKKYQNKNDFSLELKRRNLFDKNFLKKNKRYFNYKITQIHYKTDDTVLVSVSLVKPNTTDVLEGVMALAIMPQKDNGTERKKIIENQLSKMIKNSEIQLETEEQEFTLIRENGEFKILLDLGHTQRLALLEKTIESIENEADEKIRKIDFDGALHLYEKIQTLNKEAGIEGKIEELRSISTHTIKLGQEIKSGNLTIKPLRIEIRPIVVYKKNWGNKTPITYFTEEKYFVLTYEVKNHCDGEVFEPFDNKRFKKKHSINDNYGNKMNEYLLDFDMLSFEGNNLSKLAPGESRKLVAVCESVLSPKATRFLWQMNIQTDNQKTEDAIYISFTKNQIR